MSTIKWDALFRGSRGKFQKTITSSTTEIEIVPAIEGAYGDLYGLIIANTSGSACNVTIKDGGVVDQDYAVPAGDTRGFMLPKDSAVQQREKEKNWTATCSGSVDSIKVTALVNKNS